MYTLWSGNRVSYLDGVRADEVLLLVRSSERPLEEPDEWSCVHHETTYALLSSAVSQFDVQPLSCTHAGSMVGTQTTNALGVGLVRGVAIFFDKHDVVGRAQVLEAAAEVPPLEVALPEALEEAAEVAVRELVAHGAAACAGHRVCLLLLLCLGLLVRMTSMAACATFERPTPASIHTRRIQTTLKN